MTCSISPKIMIREFRLNYQDHGARVVAGEVKKGGGIFELNHC